MVISRLLKKAIHGFFKIENKKCDFPFSHIFSDATSPNMSAHRCAERSLLLAALLLLGSVLTWPTSAQVLITQVAEGQAADRAGLKTGDLLVSWQRQGQQLAIEWPLDALLAEQARGRFEGGTLSLLRDGQAISLSLAPGQWGITTEPPAEVTGPRAQFLRRLHPSQLSSEALAQAAIAIEQTRDETVGGTENQRAMRWMLAEAMDSLRDTGAAGKLWQQVLTETTDPAEQALLHYRLGRSAMITWDAAIALNWFNKALQYWTKEQALQHQMRIQTQIGYAAYEQRQLAQAEQAFSQAVELFRTHPGADPRGASALRGLAQVRAIQGRYDDAVTLGEEALQASRESEPNSLTEAKVLNFLGFANSRTHNVERGEALVREAIAMAQSQQGGDFVAAGFQVNLALIYFLRKDFELARSLYQQALEQFEKRNPISPVVARTRYNIALTLAQQNRHNEAASMLETVLELQRQLVPGTEDVARTLHSLALRYWAAGDSEQAINTELQAQALYLQLLPDSYLAATSSHSLGQMYLLTNQYPKAEVTLNDALETILRVNPESVLHAQTVFDLGALDDSLGDTTTALKRFREAVDVIESLQARLGGGDAAISTFRQFYSGFFRRLLEAELAAGDLDKAFAVSERYRAQSFLALLGSRPAALTSRLPEASKARWQTAQSNYESALKAATTLDAGGAEQAALTAARLSWRNTGDELRNVSNAGSLLSPKALTPAAIAKQLEPGQALISFISQEHHVEGFVVTHDGNLTHHSLPLGRQQLQTTAQQIRVLMGVPDAGDGSAQALNTGLKTLGDTLLKPLTASLNKVNRLIIIPDAELWLVPLSALIIDDQYLIEVAEIQLGWSATAFARQAGLASTGPLLAFADPATGAADPSPTDPNRAGIRSSTAALPGARREVNRIASLFDDSQVFLDEGASESNLRLAAAGAGVLHVAAHAVTRVDPPMESYLQLSADDQHDGRLMAWEVLGNLDLKADLVTLSGCATALGEGAAGEGLMGLTRAFGVAGARRVMASLWPVSDQATARLMGNFYQHRASGNDDATALRLAQLEFLQPSMLDRLRSGFSNRRQHPFYWAAFSLYGAQ